MKRQRGYTLIEVIVAFALLALALTLLLGALSGAARQVHDADAATRASLHAQSLLAVQGLVSPLEPGRQEGEFEQGYFHWTLETAPYVDPRPAPAQARAVAERDRLLQLDLGVRWGAAPGQRLRWRTLRLAPAPDTGAMP